jgi:hypothetical protein
MSENANMNQQVVSTETENQDAVKRFTAKARECEALQIELLQGKEAIAHLQKDGKQNKELLRDFDARSPGTYMHKRLLQLKITCTRDYNRSKFDCNPLFM